MSDISASLVKELREKTGIGIMDCKRALVETKGDITLAIEGLRKSSGVKASKKAGRSTADGIIATCSDGLCFRLWSVGICAAPAWADMA